MSTELDTPEILQLRADLQDIGAMLTRIIASFNSNSPVELSQRLTGVISSTTNTMKNDVQNKKATMNCHVFRTAMCGGGLAYDVYVPTSEVPEQLKADANGNHHTTIMRSGRSDCEYFNFPEATDPPEHRAMEYGWEKYEAWKAHEKKARQIMLRIAQRAFPELNRFGDTLPSLWVCDLMKKETSAMVEVDYNPQTEIKTIWNSDGSDGPCLICPPPRAM